ncbi:Type-5 uracil-DNA glycosylase (TTUDGB) (Uracil/hypoxanthine/xanthine DNA glycosylase), partial [Durusdinium trenchii]
MDVELAVDILSAAKYIDHLLLFSGDGDFRYAVAACQQLGARVTVVSSLKAQPPMISDDLRRQADNFIDLADLKSLARTERAIARRFRGSGVSHRRSGTGRPFTGDYAGDLLYATLTKFGFTRGSYGGHAGDGLTLDDAMITNAVRCVPPENKPTGAEANACRPFLVERFRQLPRLDAILCLGKIAHDNTLRAMGARIAAHKFAHQAQHDIDFEDRRIRVFDSYHCSRYNTNTGRLTEAMFEAVFADIRAVLVAALDRLALVDRLLALGEPDLKLGEAASVEIQAQRNDRPPFACHRPGQLGDFLAAEQEFAAPPRLVIEPVRPGIGRNVRIDEEHLVILRPDIGLSDIRTP